MMRAVAVSENVIALRNPRAESERAFLRRAEHLHDALNEHPRDEYSRTESRGDE